jgi:nitrogen fixation NifU-like protein
MYTKKVYKHFQNPANMGELKNPDVIAQVGNPVCGDVMKMYLKIQKSKKGPPFIKDIKFQTLGCAAAIATSSITTQLVKGKSLDKAKQVSGKDIARALGGLPTQKYHCSLLAVEALKKAIDQYESKNK